MNDRPQYKWSSDIETTELPATTARKEKRLNCLVTFLVLAVGILLVVGIAAIAYILIWWR